MNTPLCYVDTHLHLDEPAFDADRDEVVARAVAAGVGRLLNVGYRPKRWPTTAALAATYPEVQVALGLHPHHADEFDDRTIDDLREQIARQRPRAIGEIGLDYLRDRPPPAWQRQAFAAQLALAREAALPAVIHQRAAEEDCLAVLAAEPAPPRVVLHSFDGGARLAAFGLDRGYWFGVGGLMTRPTNRELRDIIAGLPLDRLVLETDAPYLVPSRVKLRRNEPALIPVIAERLAELRGISAAEVAERTTAAAAALFAW